MSFKAGLRFLLVAGLGMSLAAAPGCEPITSPHVAQTTVMLSVRPDGVQASGASGNPCISEDGRRVAFISNATNLVPDQGLPENHIYVKDRVDGTIHLVTRYSEQGDIPVFVDPTEFAISGDGNFVIFLSLANIATGPPPGTSPYANLFIRDIKNRTTSRAFNGAWPNQYCSNPSISRDGTRVTFTTGSDNLGIINPSNILQVYFADVTVGTLDLVSHYVDDPQKIPSSYSTGSRISSDGRCIVYASQAVDIDPNDPDVLLDVYLATIDDVTATISSEVVSLNGAGVKGDGFSSQADLSADGRYVVFHTMAPNMAPGSQNLMLRDRGAGTTVLLTPTTDGLGPNAAVSTPRISADGRFVAFRTSATNLPGSSGFFEQVYLASAAGEIRLVSVNDFGIVSDAAAGSSIGISATGSWVVWSSAAINLFSPDENGFGDVFTRGPFDR